MLRAMFSVRVVGVSLVMFAGVANAQRSDNDPDRLRVGFALGTTFSQGPTFLFPEGIGIHAQLNAVWSHSPRVSFRTDVLAQMLSGAVAEPSCVSGPCRGYAIQPDQVYSAAFSGEFRPFAAVPRLFGIAGGGVYYGRGPVSTDFGATVGASGGAGISFASPGHAGLVLEARYHYLVSTLGTLRAMLTPSIGYRF